MRQLEAKFTFSSNVTNRYDENMLISSFMRNRSKLVDILNGYGIELLNKEFDRTHNCRINLYESKEYNEFMKNGQQRFADIVNSWSVDGKDVLLYIDDDNDIYGRMKTSRGIMEIHMSLEFVR